MGVEGENVEFEGKLTKGHSSFYTDGRLRSGCIIWCIFL